MSTPPVRTRVRAVLVASAVLLAGCAGEETPRPAAPAPSAAATSAASTAVPSASTAPGAGAEVPPGDDTTVEQVVDGDTVVVTGGVRVRLIGVDTPETKDPRRGVQCFGAEAADHTGRLLAPGTKVRLAYDLQRTD